jgi:anion-transporting  ArsA/GET3 family ATPase
VTRPLRERAVLVITGKGGVGKTTIAAALGFALARRGRRVLVLETDPRETLHRLLDTAPSDGSVVKAGRTLWLQNMRPRAEIEALVRRRIPIPLVGRAVAASPVFHHFVEGAPGLKELAVLGHALRLTAGETRPRVDTVVLDAPATGHGVSLLAAPTLVAEVLGAGPVADLAGEIAALVRDRDRSGVVVVTTAEEMPVQESLELREELRSRVDRAVDALVVNALYPPLPVGGAPQDVFPLWRDRRAVNEAELAHLARAWPEGMVELPLLPHAGGPTLVAELAERLRPLLDGRADR